MFPGPHVAEARAAFARALENGMSSKRAHGLGVIASFKEGWIPRRSIARWIGGCVRTVGRMIHQAKEIGLLSTARAKKHEIPPGRSEPFTCGWSHRWIIGWGQAGKAVNDAVHAARARWLVKHAAPERKPVAAATTRGGMEPSAAARPEYQRRKWTAAEIDQELERLERLNKPPPWAPDTS